MEKRFVLSIDQGTTGTRVVIFNRKGEVRSQAYREIRQIFPKPGWVEHDPVEHWTSTAACIRAALKQGAVKPAEIASIGLTNQRETTILWDKVTGRPVYNAIVWQCRRTAAMCDKLKERGLEKTVARTTGLVIDAYFSATKIRWIIENVPGVKKKIAQGRILMGTVDSWLIWNLSGGSAHVTDYSNASRTLLLNVHTLEWDDRLLKAAGVPRSILPRLVPSSGIMAETDPKGLFGTAIPIAGDAGDQHAATFGQACFKPGMAKNTYGTALALMMNIGPKFTLSKNGLTTDLLWHMNGRTEYALEGVIFIGGAAIQWLRDGLKIIRNAEECGTLAARVGDTGGVYLVPAFTGLCAPYWDMYARGVLIGITRGTGREQVARAAMESMAYQTRDVIDAMEADCGKKTESLRVDGGATRSDFLMQFQADLLGIPVERPQITEMAALGAAYLAGLGVGFWKNTKELEKHWKLDRRYEPRMSADQAGTLYAGWQKAVKRCLTWETA